MPRRSPRSAPHPSGRRVEVRRALGHAPWDDYVPTTSDAASWLRFRGATRPPRREPRSARRADAGGPHAGERAEKVGQRGTTWFAPSADLTVHLLEPLRTEWVLAHDRARWADGGWASAETTLWDERGHSSPMPPR